MSLSVKSKVLYLVSKSDLERFCCYNGLKEATKRNGIGKFFAFMIILFIQNIFNGLYTFGKNWHFRHHSTSRFMSTYRK